MFRLKYMLLLLFLFNAGKARTQDCYGDRYLQKVFDDVKFTPNVDFGGLRQNMLGRLFWMYCDVYEPRGDTATLRPIVFMIHGGSHLDVPLLNNRSPDIVAIAMDLAKRGYVVVSPSYRLIRNLLTATETPNYSRAVINGIIDNNDAVCYFVDSYYSGNPYRIDIGKVFVGGVSSGAINTIHAIMINDTLELSPEFRGYVREVAEFNHRDLDEMFRNKYCGANILGALSLSTMLLDTTVIKHTDNAWFFSQAIHDAVTPFMAAQPAGVPTAPITFGPGIFADNLAATGTKVVTDFWDNSNHPVFFDLANLGDFENLTLEDLLSLDGFFDFAFDKMIFDSTMSRMSRFCYEQLGCQLNVGVLQHTAKPLTVFPNPSAGNITITFPKELAGKKLQLRVIDALGRLVREEQISAAPDTYRLSALPPGNYLLQVTERNNTNNPDYIGKVVMQ